MEYIVSVLTYYGTKVREWNNDKSKNEIRWHPLRSFHNGNKFFGIYSLSMATFTINFTMKCLKSVMIRNFLSTREIPKVCRVRNLRQRKIYTTICRLPRSNLNIASFKQGLFQIWTSHLLNKVMWLTSKFWLIISKYYAGFYIRKFSLTSHRGLQTAHSKLLLSDAMVLSYRLVICRLGCSRCQFIQVYYSNLLVYSRSESTLNFAACWFNILNEE